MEDLISRQAVLDTIGNVPDYYDGLVFEALSHAQRNVALLPSVNPQPKTGHWIMPVQDDGMSEPICYQVRCSECGFDLDPQTWHMELQQYGADKYCPNCGAKMIEPQESEG